MIVFHLYGKKLPVDGVEGRKGGKGGSKSLPVPEHGRKFWKQTVSFPHHFWSVQGGVPLQDKGFGFELEACMHNDKHTKPVDDRGVRFWFLSIRAQSCFMKRYNLLDNNVHTWTNHACSILPSS